MALDLSSLNIPTLQEIADERERKREPISKGPTRLERTIEARPLVKVDDKTFKAAVWLRDKNHCRKCGRKVEKVLGRVPERGEVHHIHGRSGDLRFEPIHALLLCLLDHERVTGRLNEKWVIVPTQTVTVDGQQLTDARHPVEFKRVA